jgi:hypothetical protein
MVSVSHHCRSVVQALLSDGTAGFNTTLATISESYGIDPYTINFDGTARNKNFFTGYYGPKVLDETSNFKYPVACLYTIKSQNNNQEKFRTFSGSLMLGFDVYLSFAKSAALPDTDTIGDATEETMYNVFQTESHFTFFQDVIFDGDLTISRSPLSLGASNWIQTISSKIVLDYNIT